MAWATRFLTTVAFLAVGVVFVPDLFRSGPASTAAAVTVAKLAHLLIFATCTASVFKPTRRTLKRRRDIERFWLEKNRGEEKPELLHVKFKSDRSSSSSNKLSELMMKPRRFLESLIKPWLHRDEREAKEEDDLEAIAAKEQKVFKYEILVAATRNFDPKLKLGEGGFGPVFKGRLADGREVAVKRLGRRSWQGEKEFTNEAMLLSWVQHKNVVNLYGYCSHADDKLLVAYCLSYSGVAGFNRCQRRSSKNGERR